MTASAALCRECDAPAVDYRDGLKAAFCARHRLWRSIDLVRDDGITYRQLDYWIAVGYLTPRYEPNPGCGNPRYFTSSERAVAKDMATLVKAGLRPDVASHTARFPSSVWTLAPGFALLRYHEPADVAAVDDVDWEHVGRVLDANHGAAS